MRLLRTRRNLLTRGTRVDSRAVVQGCQTFPREVPVVVVQSFQVAARADPLLPGPQLAVRVDPQQRRQVQTLHCSSPGRWAVWRLSAWSPLERSTLARAQAVRHARKFLSPRPEKPSHSRLISKLRRRMRSVSIMPYLLWTEPRLRAQKISHLLRH